MTNVLEEVSPLELYYYSLSRYCQKVLIALYEKQVEFSPKVTDLRDPIVRRRFLKKFPMGQLPIIKTNDKKHLPNASIIVEYLDKTFDTGTQLISLDPVKRLDIKLHDRLIDSEINNRLFRMDNIHDSDLPLPNHLQIKREENQITNLLNDLDEKLEKNHWLCGDTFSMADCALIPCLRHPWMQTHLKYFENLHRYKLQAETRGAWMLVIDEIKLAEAEDFIGLNQIP